MRYTMQWPDSLNSIVGNAVLTSSIFLSFKPKVAFTSSQLSNEVWVEQAYY